MSQRLACMKHKSVLPYLTDMAHTDAMAVSCAAAGQTNTQPRLFMQTAANNEALTQNFPEPVSSIS